MRIFKILDVLNDLLLDFGFNKRCKKIHIFLKRAGTYLYSVNQTVYFLCGHPKNNYIYKPHCIFIIHILWDALYKKLEIINFILITN